MTSKTLKDFFEVYRPKPPDEQKFVDKHVTIKHKDRNGNGDDVFNASKVKTVKRKADGHGYDAGEDEKVYEEVEELDELSRSLVGRYSKRARDEAEYSYRAKDRSKGRELAGKKRWGGAGGIEAARVPATESVEHIDEAGSHFKDGYYVDSSGDLAHHHEKPFKDSNSAVRFADKAEDRTGRVHTVSHVKGGKIQRQWQYQSHGGGGSGWIPHTDYKGETFTARHMKEDVFGAAADLDLIEGMLDEAVKSSSVNFKHYTFTTSKPLSGMGEGGVEHVQAHPKKITKLGVPLEPAKSYGETRLVIAKNNQTGDTSYHHVYQSSPGTDSTKPLISVRSVGKAPTHHAKHQNALKQYLAGKTSLKEAFGEPIDLNVGALSEALEKVGIYTTKGGETLTLHRSTNDKKHHMLVSKSGNVVGSFHDSAENVHKKLKDDGFSGGLKEENLDEISKATAINYFHKAQDQMRKNLEPGRQKVYRKPGVMLAKRKIEGDARVNATNEEVELEESIHSDEVFTRLAKMGAQNIRTTSNGIVYKHPKTGREHTIRHAMKKDGHRTVRNHDFKQHAARFGFNEEVEEVNELSKQTLGRYVKSAKKDVRQSGKDYVRGKMWNDDQMTKAAGKQADKRYKGIDRAIDRLTKEDIINRTIDKYVPEEVQPLTNEEKLRNSLEGIRESHVRVLVGLLNSLNEENQMRMVDAASTREGVAELLDFAIHNRGE